MATVATDESLIRELACEAAEMARAQHRSEEFSFFFSVKLTLPRLRAHHLQKALWVLNRRECWAFAQAKSPFDVKQMIWQHEEEELGGAVERGLENHFRLNIKQGEEIGLTERDFADVRPTDTTFTCMLGWTALAKDCPWMDSFASCAALELTNSEEILGHPGSSARMAAKIRDELGIGMERQHSFKEHVVADIEHANILTRVAAHHVTDAASYREAIEGLRKSWAIERVFRKGLGDLMLSIPE